MMYVHHGQICRAAPRNWAMFIYNQIMTRTSKNAQTSETQLETDRVPDNLRCLVVVAARSTTSRMKWGVLGVEAGRWERPNLQIKSTNNDDQLPGTCSNLS